MKRITRCDMCAERSTCKKSFADCTGAFPRDDKVLRSATEAEVEAGTANWCAVCDNDCPLRGADMLVVCKHFEKEQR